MNKLLFLIALLSTSAFGVDQKIYAPTGKLILDSSSSLVLKPSGGNVGIGTSTPANIFSVIGSNASSAFMSVSSGSISDGYRVGYILKNTHTGGREYSIVTTNNIDGTFGGGKLAIQDLTAGAENYRVVIDSAGKVGIGIQNPDALLTSAGNPPNEGLFETRYTAGGAADKKHWRLHHPGQVEYGIGISSGNFFHLAPTSTYPNIDGMYMNNQGDIGIGLTPDVSVKLKVASSSDFNIYSVGSPGEILALSNSGAFALKYLPSGGGTYALKWSAGGTIQYDTSSARYKKNIRDSKYGLDSVMKLKSRQFEYKKGNRSDVGLIAEEVVEVVPELVAIDSKGRPDGVSYDRMVSVLIKAVQDQQVIIEGLKKDIEAIKVNQK